MKHCFIYTGIIWLVSIPVYRKDWLKWILLIGGSHFVIDCIKFLMKKKKRIPEEKESTAYILDQLIHIFLIIVTVAVMYLQGDIVEDTFRINEIIYRLHLNLTSVISWLLAVLVIIQPVNITIKKTLYRYKPENRREGVPNAGAFVGILERCIILLMLAVGQYAAIGLVLTAKSIARYKKITEDSKFSEYYLLGTLLSTMLVIGTYLCIFQSDKFLK